MKNQGGEPNRVHMYCPFTDSNVDSAPSPASRKLEANVESEATYSTKNRHVNILDQPKLAI